MTQPVPAYVARLRNQIHAAEAASDAALSANLDLMRSILRARQAEDVPTPYVGQVTLIRLMRAAQSQISTSNDIFRAHEEMHRVATEELRVPGEEDKPVGFDLSGAIEDARAA